MYPNTASGLPQLGTLGAGNHYGEVQVVDEIFDPKAAEAMGITKIGQVVLMVHCGSRGLGHQVATDALLEMEKVKRFIIQNETRNQGQYLNKTLSQLSKRIVLGT